VIEVTRLPEPAILTEKKAEWQTKYEARRAANPTLRPPSGQYAHPRIKETLEAMSHGKCFYCEGKGKMTVDHHVEVAERGDLAFVWPNLYLACDGCQAKMPNTSIPVADCVDPCDVATRPADHLRFEKEIITFTSAQGEQTIKKYRLGRPQLVSERRRLLQQFNDHLIAISKTEGWEKMGPIDRQRLLAYGQADSPFSLMFRAYLDALALAPPAPVPGGLP
jgi:hypothetical protein